MKTKFLFSQKFNKIGWILLILAILFQLSINIFGSFKVLEEVPVFSIYDSGIILQSYEVENPIFGFKKNNIHDEIFILLFVSGCLLIGFSKLKNEDEFTFNLRLKSLIWSVYFVFVTFLLTVIFIYGHFFLYIQFFSLIAFLVIYILRFYYLLLKSRKFIVNEE